VGQIDGGGRAGGEGGAGHEDQGGAVSFGGLEGEGQLGPGLALAQDDFLLLLLLLLTVLVQLHALLVNLSLLLYNAQLLLGLSKANGRQKEQGQNVSRRLHSPGRSPPRGPKRVRLGLLQPTQQ